jgi:hypothetical protein
VTKLEKAALDAIDELDRKRGEVAATCADLLRRAARILENPPRGDAGEYKLDDELRELADSCVAGANRLVAEFKGPSVHTHAFLRAKRRSHIAGFVDHLDVIRKMALEEL